MRYNFLNGSNKHWREIMNLEQWEAQGNYHNINDKKIFVYDSGGKREAIVILHGYPTSSHDFHKVLPILQKKYRVIVHDHIGFGLSDKPVDYSYSLIEQADVALLLWQQLGVKSAHLVSHDYGTSVATEIIARRNMGDEPVKLHSLTLSNGSVHIELAKLRIIQKLLRNKVLGPLVAKLSSRRIFAKNMKQLWHDPAKLSDAEIGMMWQLLVHKNGKSVLPKITQYLRDRVLFWHRWVGGLQKSTLRTNILWGASDPITGADVAKVHHEEMQNSSLKILEDLGHYPMLEGPDEWAQALMVMLKQSR
jgi:pimeloyl-ACP methyl ester carboxylesterase